MRFFDGCFCRATKFALKRRNSGVKLLTFLKKADIIRALVGFHATLERKCICRIEANVATSKRFWRGRCSAPKAYKFAEGSRLRETAISRHDERRKNNISRCRLAVWRQLPKLFPASSTLVTCSKMKRTQMGAFSLIIFVRRLTYR